MFCEFEVPGMFRIRDGFCEEDNVIQIILFFLEHGVIAVQDCLDGTTEHGDVDFICVLYHAFTPLFHSSG